MFIAFTYTISLLLVTSESLWMGFPLGSYDPLVTTRAVPKDRPLVSGRVQTMVPVYNPIQAMAMAMV